MVIPNHPALYPAMTPTHTHGLGQHFVPEGWEDLEKGICPCGTVVQWDRVNERWDEWHTAYVLIVNGPGFDLQDAMAQIDLQDQLREDME